MNCKMSPHSMLTLHPRIVHMPEAIQQLVNHQQVAKRDSLAIMSESSRALLAACLQHLSGTSVIHVGELFGDTNAGCCALRLHRAEVRGFCDLRDVP